MAKMTLDQFKQAIKEKLVTAGEIDASAGIGDLVYDNTYNNFDENSVYDLISIKNNVNNKGLVYLEVRTAVNGTPVQCTYSLDSYNPGYVSFASHIYLMGLYSGVENGSVCDNKIERNSHSEGFGSTDSLFCYERPYTGNAFLCTGGGHGGTTYGTNVEHVCLQCQGLNYDPDISSAGDPNGFYEGMALADIPVLSNYTMNVIANNVSMEYISPEPPGPSGNYTQLELWKGFKKRPNSTKKPSIPGTTIDVLLKRDTSVLEPVFTLNSQEFDYNYCKWGNRYYYIEDTISVRNDHIDIVCKADPAASWRSDIFNTEAYIERTGSMGQSNIYDPLFPPTIDYEVKHTSLFNWKNVIHPSGNTQEYYIIAVVTSNDGNTAQANGVTYFGIAYTNLIDIMKFVGDKDFDSNWRNQMNDLRSCILSLKHVPYVPQGTTKDIYIGGENTGISGQELSQTPLTFGTANATGAVNGFVNITTAFPSRDHNQAYSYLDLPPYSTGMIYLPWVGLVELDLNMFGPLASRKIKVEGYIDQMTADVIYRISCKDTSTAIATYSGNCGSDMPIATQHYNPLGIVSGAIQTVGGTASALAAVPVFAAPTVGAKVMGAQAFIHGASQAAQGISNMISGFQLETQTNGSLSTYLGSQIDDECWIEIFTKVPPTINGEWLLDSVKEKYGLPFNRMGRIGDQQYYVKTNGCSVNMAGTAYEKSIVNSMCDAGIYIE